MILLFGALFGFIAVAFDAYAEHGLRGSISDDQFRFLMTALRYNQLYAIVVSAIGVVQLNGGKLASQSIVQMSGVLFIVGTVLFSGSIYLSITLDWPSLTRIAPIGGMTLMVAWLALIVASVKLKWFA